MKVSALNLGACGYEQLMFAGSVAHDTEGADNGAVLCTLPANIIVTRAVAVVGEAFADAGTLTVGSGAEAKDLLGDEKVTATTIGTYSEPCFTEFREKTEIKAKLGGSPSAGKADIYLSVVRIPAE